MLDAHEFAAEALGVVISHRHRRWGPTFQHGEVDAVDAMGRNASAGTFGPDEKLLRRRVITAERTADEGFIVSPRP